MAVALSVVVAAQNMRDTVGICLDSLRKQSVEVQIILADSSCDGTAGFVTDCYPQVLLVTLPHPSSLPFLLGAGMAKAQGEIIAITEAHCTFPSDWAQKVISAHERTDEPVIGGAVEPGDKLSLSDWGLYFADYGQFMQPLRPGQASEMPGENVSFKRIVLDEAKLDYATAGFWKTFFCQLLERAGYRLIAVPEIVIYYNRRLSAGQILWRRWLHGRCFGAMRSERRSGIRHMVFAVVGLSLPILLTYRLFRKVWPKGRYRRKFLLSLPIALLAICAWSAGEWWGNAFGAGNSCKYV